MINRLSGMNVTIFLAFTLLVGCGANKAEEEARGFVQSYCSIMQDAYSRVDLKILGQMTTEKEMRKLIPLFQAMSVTGNSMKTEILEFKIKKAKVEENRATVRTSERWRYWWTDQKTGVITKPKHEESYDLEYNLLKVGGSWKVDSIKNLNDPGK
ncbi:MAG: hypothetical protein A2075_00440 [Geobacteraceae bacterium GWC2_58_44]|nr:MAG: hypothetical protein A2075_00440 [Geobacteraceae bacterium GWC2_58_44]HBG06425.1 hypothetical protein [Geobacter sp.]